MWDYKGLMSLAVAILNVITCCLPCSDNWRMVMQLKHSSVKPSLFYSWHLQASVAMKRKKGSQEHMLLPSEVHFSHL